VSIFNSSMTKNHTSVSTSLLVHELLESDQVLAHVEVPMNTLYRA
jgi:hypothetical protein